MTALHEVMLTVKGVITDNKQPTFFSKPWQTSTDLHRFAWLDLRFFRIANRQRLERPPRF